MQDSADKMFYTQKKLYMDILHPVFLPNKNPEGDILKYLASLLRVLGMEDGGWDPYAESSRTLNDLNSLLKMRLPKNRFPDPDLARWRIGLLLYAHIVEMDAPYEVLANLIRFQIGKGYSPSPFYDFLTEKEKKSFRRLGISTLRKIAIIKMLASEIGLRVGDTFDDFYDNKLRNAIQHSDFILTDNGFRSRGGISGIRAYQIDYATLDQKILKAKAFIAAFFQMESITRQVWGTKKRKKIRYDERYKGILEILANSKGLMCGFKIHWPNNSESVYRRTEAGIEMQNCSLDISNAAISLFVDLYARNPGKFSPLVEMNGEPKYTPLDGSSKPLKW